MRPCLHNVGCGEGYEPHQLLQIDRRESTCQVMQKQFDVWKLTASEQDVMPGLLKGLSFREVAEICQAVEKTVDRQAAVCFEKPEKPVSMNSQAGFSRICYSHQQPM